MNTYADDVVYSAKDHIKRAIQDLSLILVDECEGSGEFSKEFMGDLSVVFHELMKLKNKFP